MLITNLMGFSSNLTVKYTATDDDLPIARQHLDALMAKLQDGDHTYLTIHDGNYTEVIRVSGTCSTIVVERGFDGTAPHTFPEGSCVSFEVTPSVVKDLVCETDCCPAACDPVKLAGNTMPASKMGVPFEGVVMFSGSAPMRIAVGIVPSWMSVAIGPNFARLYGTPTFTGSVIVPVSAANQGAMVSTTANIAIAP
jgi:hypothetical protein